MKKPRSEVRQRTEMVAFRVVPAEKKLLDAAAAARGVSLSEYIRSSALLLAQVSETNQEDAMTMPAEPETTLFPDLPVPVPATDPPASAFPPPVNDFGLVELELMGHRYRIGQLAEVVIAGQPFLRLTTKDGRAEFYRPDAVYCLTPMPDGAEPKPRAAIPSGWREDWDSAEDGIYDDTEDDRSQL